MIEGAASLWMLVIAMAALAAWWLTGREQSSYRGAGRTVSTLIVLMALLMCILAVRGQGGRGGVGPRTALVMGR